MTKKHFIIAANQFGRMLRNSDDKQAVAIWDAVEVFCRVASSVNYQFSRSIFIEWINDVADGVRDTDGRKTDAVIME